jgi:hypothetical protein
VLRDDVLGRATAHRVKDIVHRVFARRFLIPNIAPAEHLKTFIGRDHSGRVFSDICVLYAARNDDLLRDIIVRLYWPALTDGRLELSVEDVVEFIRGAENEGLMLTPWSEPVKIKVARGLLKALVDFGYLRNVGRHRRETVVDRPTDALVIYLAHNLHFKGSTDAGLVRHPDWELFGLSERALISEMDRLTGEDWWVIQAAGSVIRIYVEIREHATGGRCPRWMKPSSSSSI